VKASLTVYVPAAEAVMVHVAVATFAEPAKLALVDVQAEIPAVPPTVKATVPLGVAPLVGPVSVAVKTMLPPTVVTPLLVTTLVGVAAATVLLSPVAVAAR
jgi:hypothetical protein